MLPSFVLFHVENVNENRNSVCHLILIPVIDGIQQDPQHFYMNPEAPFEYVSSGITSEEVDTFPSVATVWPKIQNIFNEFPLAICSAEGYAACSIFGTLTRLNVPHTPILYCNAKAILRRTMDEISYSLDFLSYKIYGDFLTYGMPQSIAQRWCDLVLKALEPIQSTSLDDYIQQLRITIGVISFNDFKPSLCKRVRNQNTFSPSSVVVNANPDNPFFGMNVVFTGKLESFKRDDARAAIVKIGGMAPERLTKDTDYLVVGVQDLRVVGEKGLSGKMKTAEKYKEKGLQIEIIDENEFIEMLNS